jgi:DNA repair protein REV1 C-terminal domain
LKISIFQIPKPADDNVFLQVDWRQQISSWIESADAPETFDVEMLAKNAQDLVNAKRIEQLYLVLKLLYRYVV